MPLSEEDINSLYSELLNRLVESGDWDRIKGVLDSKLNESGWKDQVKDQAKEQARKMEQLSFHDLLESVKPGAQATIPPAIRKEIIGLIRQHIDKQCE